MSDCLPIKFSDFIIITSCNLLSLNQLELFALFVHLYSRKNKRLNF